MSLACHQIQNIAVSVISTVQKIVLKNGITGRRFSDGKWKYFLKLFIVLVHFFRLKILRRSDDERLKVHDFAIECPYVELAKQVFAPEILNLVGVFRQTVCVVEATLEGQLRLYVGRVAQQFFDEIVKFLAHRAIAFLPRVRLPEFVQKVSDARIVVIVERVRSDEQPPVVRTTSFDAFDAALFRGVGAFTAASLSSFENRTHGERIKRFKVNQRFRVFDQLCLLLIQLLRW